MLKSLQKYSQKGQDRGSIEHILLIVGIILIGICIIIGFIYGFIIASLLLIVVETILILILGFRMI